MINYGKYMCEAVCPLCDTIYILSSEEAELEDVPEEKKERCIFYCEDCDRYVRSPTWKLVKCSHDWLNDYLK